MADIQKVYVYQDSDNGVVEVFKTFDDAKRYFLDYYDGDPCIEECNWSGSSNWNPIDYVTITKRNVRKF